MRWISNKVDAWEAERRTRIWRKHFCWIPTIIGYGPDHRANVVWLDWVERRKDWRELDTPWEYREVQK